MKRRKKMPKSRNRKKNRGPKKGPRVPNMSQIEKLAKALDTPELRKLYLRQKKANPNLDQEVEKMSENIEEIFHDLSSKK
jgi:hypothetical protein